MEIRELYRDEIVKLEEAGRDALGARFHFSRVELRVLRNHPDAFIPVAVAGTEIIGIALAKISEDQSGRVGTVHLLASFVEPGMIDRAIKWAILSRLENRFKELEVLEIHVLGSQDSEFRQMLRTEGYRLELDGSNPPRGGTVTEDRFVKKLYSREPPWVRR